MDPTPLQSNLSPRNRTELQLPSPRQPLSKGEDRLTVPTGECLLPSAQLYFQFTPSELTGMA